MDTAPAVGSSNGANPIDRIEMRRDCVDVETMPARVKFKDANRLEMKGAHQIALKDGPHGSRDAGRLAMGDCEGPKMARLPPRKERVDSHRTNFGGFRH